MGTIVFRGINSQMEKNESSRYGVRPGSRGFGSKRVKAWDRGHSILDLFSQSRKFSRPFATFWCFFPSWWQIKNCYAPRSTPAVLHRISERTLLPHGSGVPTRASPNLKLYQYTACRFFCSLRYKHKTVYRCLESSKKGLALGIILALLTFTLRRG